MWMFLPVHPTKLYNGGIILDLKQFSFKGNYGSGELDLLSGYTQLSNSLPKVFQMFPIYLESPHLNLNDRVQMTKNIKPNLFATKPVILVFHKHMLFWIQEMVGYYQDSYCDLNKNYQFHKNLPLAKIS